MKISTRQQKNCAIIHTSAGIHRLITLKTLNARKLKMAKVVTGKVRASFFKADIGEVNKLNGKHEYSVQIIINKDDAETVSAIKSAAKQALVEKFGDKIPKNIRNPLRDGDTETNQDGEPKGVVYEEKYFMNVKSNKRPGIINTKGVEVADGKIKSGDYIRVSLNAFGYSNAGNNGVSFGLNNVLFVEEGESIGSGRTTAADDFGIVAVTEVSDSDWA